MRKFIPLLGLLALWRAMAMQLSVPTTPWAWALGNAAACLIALGLLPSGTARAITAPPPCTGGIRPCGG